MVTPTIFNQSCYSYYALWHIPPCNFPFIRFMCTTLANATVSATNTNSSASDKSTPECPKVLRLFNCRYQLLNRQKKKALRD